MIKSELDKAIKNAEDELQYNTRQLENINRQLRTEGRNPSVDALLNQTMFEERIKYWSGLLKSYKDEYKLYIKD